MNVSCPECSTIYRVDPIKVPAGGVLARCGRCPGVFAVELGSTADRGAGTTAREDSRIPEQEAVTPRAESDASDASPTAGAPGQPNGGQASAGSAAVSGSTDRTAETSIRTDREGVLQEVRGPDDDRQSADVTQLAGDASEASGEEDADRDDLPYLHRVSGDSPGGEGGVGTPEAATDIGRHPQGPDLESLATAQSGEHRADQAEESGVDASSTARNPAGEGVSGGPAEQPLAPGEAALPPPPFGALSDPHRRATRLARALVSDIVVYHPDRRARSLRQGTLRQEFRDEIRKSWEEYANQVGGDFARQTTYFRDALNEILANGSTIF